MNTYEIDKVNVKLDACKIDRLFGCVSEIKVKTEMYYFRVVTSSGNAHEIEGLYLSTEDTMNAILKHKKENM